MKNMQEDGQEGEPLLLLLLQQHLAYMNLLTLVAMYTCLTKIVCSLRRGLVLRMIIMEMRWESLISGLWICWKGVTLMIWRICLGSSILLFEGSLSILQHDVLSIYGQGRMYDSGYYEVQEPCKYK